MFICYLSSFHISLAHYSSAEFSGVTLVAKITFRLSFCVSVRGSVLYPRACWPPGRHVAKSGDRCGLGQGAQNLQTGPTRMEPGELLHVVRTTGRAPCHRERKHVNMWVGSTGKGTWGTGRKREVTENYKWPVVKPVTGSWPGGSVGWSNVPCAKSLWV